MEFKTISSKQPDIETMRQRMKAKNLVHADPLMADTPAKPKVTEGSKRGRKAVKIYTCHFSTYLSKDQENALYNWCEENGVTPSVAIRMAVAKMLSE